MATLLGSLMVKLGLDSGQFKSGLSDAQRDLQKATKSIQRIGQDIAGLGARMSVGVTAPLAAIGVASVKAAVESRDAIGQVEAALKSMGDGAGRTSEQLQDLAGGIMKKSLYDDDQILREVTANLLTFGTISGATFDRAQQAAVDLAARLGTDLQSATLMVGKALNDPVKGLTALSRSGIQFTAQQKEQIKAMVAAGDAAGAQSIMLAELEAQFGGAAKAARDADPFGAIQQSWADFQETVGEQLLQAMPAITGAIEGLLEAFNSLSPGMQQAIVVAAVLAAALGPVMFAFGTVVSAMAPFLAALGAAFSAGGIVVAAKAALVGLAAAFGPILVPIAAVAAAGALIYANWDKIAPVLIELGATASNVLGSQFTAAITAVTESLKALWEGPLGDAIRLAIDLVGEIGATFAYVFGNQIVATLGAAVSLVGGAIEAIANVLRILVSLLTGDFSGAWEAVKDLVAGVVRAMAGAIESFVPGAVGAMRNLYLGVKQWLQDKLAAVFNWVGDKVREVTGFFEDMYIAVVGNSYVPDMVREVGAEFSKLQALMVVPAKKAAKDAKEAFRDMAGDVQSLLDELFPRIAALRDFKADQALLEKARNAGLISPELEGEARFRLRKQNPLYQDGKPTLSFEDKPIVDPGILKQQADEIDRILSGTASRTKVQTVRIAESFKDMAKATLDSMRGMVDAIKGGSWLDILDAAIKLFMQVASTGLLGKSLQANVNKTVPAYANGTAWHPGGLALIGERGPELVNLKRGAQVYDAGKTREMLGGGLQVTVAMDPSTAKLGAFVRNESGEMIAAAAPSMIDGAAQVAGARMSRRQTRQLV